jgi:hypothetical protein
MCDRCGQPLEEGALRYTAKIEVFAAYDPLEITFEDMTKDHTAEINQLLEQCRGMTEEELMRDVYVKMEFDLCRSCQRVLLANPLPEMDDEK